MWARTDGGNDIEDECGCTCEIERTAMGREKAAGETDGAHEVDDVWV